MDKQEGSSRKGAADRQDEHGRPPRPASSAKAVRKSKKSKGLSILAFFGLLAVLLLSVLGWTFRERIFDVRPDPPKPPSLAERMKAVAKGGDGGPHVKMEARGQGRAVVADAVLHGDCVATAWSLARDGVVVIDGNFSQKLSAGKLADMCAEDPKGSVLEWYPR